MMLDSNKTKYFFSSGKLMLTGEYLVLKGSLSLALPLRFGQGLKVTPHDGAVLHWETLVEDRGWFQAGFSLPGLDCIETNDPKVAYLIQKLLTTAQSLNPSFLQGLQGYRILSFVDFKLDWGIGSSSSLVSNIAGWAGCDPYRLNSLVFHGSGYDIACARSKVPVLYRLSDDKPVNEPAEFHPVFGENLLFVWLNKKQNTCESISAFNRDDDYSEEIETVNAITMAMIETKNLHVFQQLMYQHEQIVSSILKIKPVKERLFPDFPGSVKSLGAWGGDFVMAASELPVAEVKEYFNQKGYHTVLGYNDVIFK